MLPLRYVDEIHARLQVRYGAKWSNLWVGIDPALVKTDWAEELSGLDGRCIKYGLVNLPVDYPPTVMQFRAICIRRPDAELPALPAPNADPARVADAIKRAATAQRTQDPKAWAHRLRVREQQLDRLTQAQRTMWRAAIGNVVDAA